MKSILLFALNSTTKVIHTASAIVHSRGSLNGVNLNTSLESIQSLSSKRAEKVTNFTENNSKINSNTSHVGENELKDFDHIIKEEVAHDSDYHHSILPKSDKISLRNFQQSESSVPSSSVGRAARFGWLGVSIVGNAIPGTIKSKIMKEEGKTFKSHLISEKNSDKLAKTLCKMRGAALKFGQLLSTFEDVVIPEPLRSALEKARQDANAMPKSQLLKTLTNDFGLDWEGKFKSFQVEPFAAASIGQVHFAEIEDPQNSENIIQVAVKVQFPGVAQSIESDLNNLKRVFKYLNIIPKGLYIDKLVDNLGREIKEECDYKLEANKQKQYRDMISKDNNLKRSLYVPLVFENLSTDNILTTEFLPGINVDEIENESQEIRDFVGEKLLELCLREIFIHRFMQTDPNPANFFIYNSGSDSKAELNLKNIKIGLIDFGAARDYNKEFVLNYLKIVYYATVVDKEKVIDFSKDLGFLTGFESEIMLNAHANSVFAIAEPFSKLAMNEKYFDFGNQSVTKRIYSELPVMLKHRLTSPPTEIYSLHRRLSGAYLMCIKLKSKVRSYDLFHKIVKEFELMNNAKI